MLLKTLFGFRGLASRNYLKQAELARHKMTICCLLSLKLSDGIFSPKWSRKIFSVLGGIVRMFIFLTY